MTGEAHDQWLGDLIFWTRCTCGKRGYHARGDARARKRQHSDRKGLNVYRCKESQLFHIGHKPKALGRGQITRDQIEHRRTA